VIFEPLDFIARLAALVLKPRVNLTRFHGVFARRVQEMERALSSSFTVVVIEHTTKLCLAKC